MNVLSMKDKDPSTKTRPCGIHAGTIITFLSISLLCWNCYILLGNGQILDHLHYDPRPDPRPTPKNTLHSLETTKNVPCIHPQLEASRKLATLFAATLDQECCSSRSSHPYHLRVRQEESIALACAGKFPGAILLPFFRRRSFFRPCG